MPVQVDEGGGAALLRTIEDMGLTVHTGVGTQEIVVDEAGAVTGMKLSDGSELATDLVVFSAGVRPRDQLARDCGLTVGERGGIAVDEQCRTADDPHVFAIGECALASDGRVYGLVAPGYEQAETAAATIAGGRGLLHRRRPVHQAEAARRGRGVLRRRARRRPTTASTSSTPTPAPASTRSWSSAATASCSAASWSATRRRTARCGRSPARSRRSRPSRWSCPAGAGGAVAARPVRAAGRGDHLLLPQRHQGHDPRRGHRPPVHHRARGQEVHQGRYGLRQLRQGPRPAGHRRAGGQRRRGRQGPVRLLLADPRGAVRDRPRPAHQHVPGAARPLRPRRRPGAATAARSASRRSARSSPPSPRRSARAATSWTASRRRCRTPTTTSSPTSRRTARTRSSRASPAVRSPPRA